MKPTRRIVATGLFTFALIALVGVGVWYQFFRDDAPPRVSLAAAVATVATPTTSTSGPTSDAAGGIDGTWAVAPDSDSFVGYRIGEELASIGTTEAVGRTSSIDGSVTIAGGTLTSVTLTADMTSLESDESRRDQALERQSLQTSSFPTATFELTEPVTIADTLTSGEAMSIVATGDLTLHGVTQSIQIPLEVQYTNGVLVVVGSLDITLADYDIDPPSSPSVVSVNDTAVLEIQLMLNQPA